MKRKKVLKRLKWHTRERRYVRLTRENGAFGGISTGFILDMSRDFILFQETDEFRMLGFQIFPVETIKHVRYNKNDRTYEEILKSEDLMEKVGLKYEVDLSNWKSICKDVKKIGLTIISECEHPSIKSFCIGELRKVSNKSISIRYFNAQGIFDRTNTKNRFEDITKLSFDDHYANTFSRYTKKSKKS